ncbi:hypothetical protein NEPAR06_0635 [Nematocida parisii]|uniref:Serine/threonine protein kinase n=1 Tax=Nematocida parisii (strain ERTm3) TaxID=935791 RepID=I3EEX9_NEMP3|nr:serine/threonine protein kinase [Nematocida parisii ERTm1]EIJ87776.1 serine/threonine protein kinase [Nematocida parisii ERTm3]KAI5127221.1 hypothetical protein NEPAR08_0818 [Nematocida parisii]EIJ93001.1 serine/threonine protein kinase [Nematocida parisii ERTm1]KAI5127282.1 hypothetical protein NEPAR03_0886 [Nematocida parisii]KAI5141390.1 hypothetical protein NEPAR04_0943 [Nematocida parisii]|eukprot:XP_013059784.1 serine/threonine protein kinase [Nematocida parisii ERTm1]
MRQMIIYNMLKVMLMCSLVIAVYATSAINHNPEVDAPQEMSKEGAAEYEQAVKQTKFYKKMKGITDEIDRTIERARKYLASGDTNMLSQENSNYQDFLEQNNLTPVQDAYLSQVYVYSGDLYDLLSIPKIAENIEDKVHRKIVIKRALNIAEYDMRECEICMSVNHPNVLQTYFVYEAMPESYQKDNQTIVWLFQEYLENKIPAIYNEGSVQEKALKIQHRTIIRDVARGLSYLHKNRIIHLDVKIQNTVGTYSKSRGRIIYKIIDFGFSRILNEEEPSIHIKNRAFGTDPFRSPEVYLKSIHGYSSDVWCLGLLAAYVGNIHIASNRWAKKKGISVNITGEQIPINADMGHVYEKFLNGTIKIAIGPEYPVILAEFIKACTVRDEKERPTVDELLENHPYLQSNNALYAEEVTGDVEKYTI